MALPLDLETLNYQDGGLPFFLWAASNLNDTQTLDYQDAGLPFFSQFDTQTLASAVVTISSAEQQAHVNNRRFPNKRPEMVHETQTKHISPLAGAQYSVYLP